MKLSSKFYLLFSTLVLLIAGTTQAQNIKLAGFVIDNKSREPLIGANVFLQNTSIGTITDPDGYFSLFINREYLSDSLFINYLGYEEFHISVKDVKENMIITLTPRILHVEKGITVYAKKLDLARQEIPHTSHVVNLEEIERYGTSEISDLFKLDPTVRIEGNDLDGRYIQIRGSDPDEVNVYIDGILINNPAFNDAADISVISPDNIEKLEILKGSNLVLLGSGAFGGVVNITTRTTTEPEYGLKFKYGSSMNRLISADLNIPLNDRIFVNYFGNLNTFSPEIEYYTSERYDEKTHTTTVKTIKQNHHLSLNYFTDLGQYTGKVIGYILDYDKPGWTNLRKNLSIAGAYKGEILSAKDFDLNISYIYADDLINRGNIDENAAQVHDNFTTQRLYLRLAKKFATESSEATNLSFQFLGEYLHDELFKKQELEDKNRTSILYDAFLYDNRASLGGVISIGDKLDSLGQITWKLFGGIRGEFLAIGDNYKISTYGFQIDIDKENWTLTPYMNYGDNIKIPTLLDNAFVQVQDLSISNSSFDPVRLLPQLSKSQEIGVNFQLHPPTSFYRNIDFRLAIFSNEIANRLMKRPLEGTIVETQLGVNHTDGFECILKINGMLTNWSLGAAYGSFNVSNPLLYAYKPDEKYSLQLDYHSNFGFYIMGLVYHEGKSVAWDYDDQHQFITAEVPSFYDMDVSLGYQFKFDKIELKVFAAGYNIFDNAGYRFYNLKKRFLQVGLGIKY